MRQICEVEKIGLKKLNFGNIFTENMIKPLLNLYLDEFQSLYKISEFG